MRICRIIINVLILFVCSNISAQITGNIGRSRLADLESSDEFLALSDSARIIFLKEACWENRDYDLENAYSYGLHALKLARSFGYHDHIAELYNFLGVVQRNAGNYTPALDHFLDALKCSENYEILRQTGYSLNNIGNIYHLQGKYEEAASYIKRALEIVTQLNDKAGMAYCNYQLSKSLEGLNKIDSALVCNFTALNLRTQIKGAPRITVSLRNIARIYQNQLDFPNTRKYLFQSLDYAKLATDKSELATTVLLIGQYFCAVDSLEYAKDYFLSTMLIGSGSIFWDRKRDAANGLSVLFSEKKDDREALQYHRLYKIYGDSLAQQATLLKLNGLSLQYKYDEEKKELLQMQDRQVRRTKWILVFLVSGLLIISAFAIILYKQNHIKRRTNIELANKNALIQSQKDELEHYSKELNESNRTKDKFFSIIAHDLRSPFNSILYFSEILLKKIEQREYADIEEYCRTILNSSRHSYNLLVNLLEWSRSQTGKMEFIPEIFELNYLIEEVTDLISHAFIEKNINLQMQLQPGLKINADHNMMSTILRNLLSNAFKFSNAGTTVIITATSNSKGVEVSVKDTGLGISRDNIDKLFKVGQDFTMTGTNNEEGTGLGLILCSEFIERHNGKIWVTSEFGKGTSFFFTIPC